MYKRQGVRKMDLIRWGLLDNKIEAMKESLCLMLDNQHPVTIFDKTYQPSDFPTVLYYKMRTDDKLYVDYSSPNYYQELGTAPAGYEKIDWFPKIYAKPETGSGTTYRDELAKILVMATGINASYDYSALLGKLKNGEMCIRDRWMAMPLLPTVNRSWDVLGTTRRVLSIYIPLCVFPLLPRVGPIWELFPDYLQSMIVVMPKVMYST